eukprot:TRINITY_DN6571_c0_g1_i1.p1 TRINITY_DN6571_c0_g1~~TRINITY_DN6571_c0_g1_i1.p1  ORF type:complete len:116 (+),score=11.92 TRINITY_DN6571_c0_g1_i1:244-591(+)
MTPAQPARSQASKKLLLRTGRQNLPSPRRAVQVLLTGISTTAALRPQTRPTEHHDLLAQDRDKDLLRKSAATSSSSSLRRDITICCAACVHRAASPWHAQSSAAGTPEGCRPLHP